MKKRTGEIAYELLKYIHENPGQRPSEIYKALAHRNIGGHWMRHLKDHRFAVDVTILAYAELFRAWEASHPQPEMTSDDYYESYIKWARSRPERFERFIPPAYVLTDNGRRRLAELERKFKTA